jgi:antitoxin (DNA-binding transcriptional repressor) of toxin-antitoxin stability system
MSTATISELGANLHTFLAAVRVGDTVAVMDGGKEIARLVPSRAAKPAPAAVHQLDSWAQHRLEELNQTFPEPIMGVGEIFEESRTDIWER